jgi:hypothetical protein
MSRFTEVAFLLRKHDLEEVILTIVPDCYALFLGHNTNAEPKETLLAMLRCPLSLWERVRVRVPQGWRTDHTPSPPALSRGERELGHAQQGLLDMH